MRVVNEESFSNCRQRPIGGVEVIVCTHIVQRSDPFSLQYSPESLGNIQVWRIRRQIEKEQASFLPGRPQFPYFMITVDSGIIRYDKRIFTHLAGECIEKIGNLVCGDTLCSGETLITILAVNHSEYVKPCASLGYDACLPSRQLPTVGHISPGADIALISIVGGNTTFTLLLFKFLLLLEFVLVGPRQGDSSWAFSYSLISCANADKKRLNIILLASFPVTSYHIALALPTLCLSCPMTARTTSSSGQSIIGFRPRPERVCRPVMPSERKRFTHAFTDIKLISVCSPAFDEDRSSALKRTARQRICKQWLVLLRKSSPSCPRGASVNSSFFIFPIDNRIHHNRT